MSNGVVSSNEKFAGASRPWLVPVVGAAIIIAIMVTLATVYGGAGVVFDLLLTLVPAAGLAGVWLTAAWGIGWPLRSIFLKPDGDDAGLLQGALGIAALLTIDGALGRISVMQLGGAVGAYALTVIGIVLLVIQLRRRFSGRTLALPAVSPLWLAAAPAIAVLLLASCSAPGWLWDTEFGGYDALSYHLQLPKEWMAAGAIRPLEHNVYSYLPGAMEGAFYHLMVVRGDAVATAAACQVLHASFAILAALLVGTLVRRIVSTIDGDAASTGITASILCIGTPWIVVCGSLAYNDVAVVMFLAAGMLLLSRSDDDCRTIQTGAALGFIAGAACTCKLTACGFAAAPLMVVAMIIRPPRVCLRMLLPFFAAGLFAGAPYFIGNWLAGGNPVFPFATNTFGAAHWSAEQVSIWRSAHAPPGDFAARLGEAWNQFVRFGIGPAPDAGEPWFAQWSVLPWLGIAGIGLAITDGRTRRWGIALAAMLVVQLVFWLMFTHIKSRFMLPATVPLAVGEALGGWILFVRFAPARTGDRIDVRRAIVAASLFAWCCVVVWIFAQQRDGRPAAWIGSSRAISGEAFGDAEIQQVAAEGALSATVFINRLLPRGSRVLFLGEAAPFYYSTDRLSFDYQTTYDRGDLSELIRTVPDQPHAWLRSLRDRGYSHILIDPNMLSRWQDDGWGDPLLDTEEILDAVATHTHVLYRSPTGVVIARLR